MTRLTKVTTESPHWDKIIDTKWSDIWYDHTNFIRDVDIKIWKNYELGPHDTWIFLFIYDENYKEFFINEEEEIKALTGFGVGLLRFSNPEYPSNLGRVLLIDRVWSNKKGNGTKIVNILEKTLHSELEQTLKTIQVEKNSINTLKINVNSIKYNFYVEGICHKEGFYQKLGYYRIKESIDSDEKYRQYLSLDDPCYLFSKSIYPQDNNKPTNETIINNINTEININNEINTKESSPFKDQLLFNNSSLACSNCFTLNLPYYTPFQFDHAIACT